MGRETIPVDDVEDLLHRLNGGAVLRMRDHLPQDVKVAANCEGHSVAYRRLLQFLDYYEEHGEFPDAFEDDVWEEYESVSRAMERADDSVGESGEPPEIGVQ